MRTIGRSRTQITNNLIIIDIRKSWPEILMMKNLKLMGLED